MQRNVRRLALMLALSAVPAVAQTVAGSTSTGAARSPAGATVIHPGRSIDPGMKVVRPTVPPASTPVIKPRTTAPDGSVLVPK